MKKGFIFLFFLIIIIIPAQVYATGEKEKSIIIPRDTMAFVRIDVQKNLDARITPLLLDLIYSFRDMDVHKGAGRRMLDEESARAFGVRLEDIRTITLSLLSFDMEQALFPAGVHVTLEEGKARQVLSHINITYESSVENYREKTYQVIQVDGNLVCIHTAGADLFLSSDRTAMEQMLDIRYNLDSEGVNPALYKRAHEHRETPFYAAGYVPGGTDTALTYPYDHTEEFGLTITLADDFSFVLNLRGDSAEMADEILTAVKGSLALAGMMILSQDEKAYKPVTTLIQGIEYEQKGRDAFISGRFTEKDLTDLLDLLPLFFMMMK